MAQDTVERAMADEVHGQAQELPAVRDCDNEIKLRKQIYAFENASDPTHLMNFLAMRYPVAEKGAQAGAGRAVLHHFRMLFSQKHCMYCGAPHGSKRCPEIAAAKKALGDGPLIVAVFEDFENFDKMARKNNSLGLTQIYEKRAVSAPTEHGRKRRQKADRKLKD